MRYTFTLLQSVVDLTSPGSPLSQASPAAATNLRPAQPVRRRVTSPILHLARHAPFASPLPHAATVIASPLPPPPHAVTKVSARRVPRARKSRPDTAAPRLWAAPRPVLQAHRPCGLSRAARRCGTSPIQTGSLPQRTPSQPRARSQLAAARPNNTCSRRYCGCHYAARGCRLCPCRDSVQLWLYGEREKPRHCESVLQVVSDRGGCFFFSAVCSRECDNKIDIFLASSGF